jgi:hypothetical protein
MAEHLSDKDISNIVLLIDTWNNDVKLTWEKLRKQMLNRCGLAQTRQTIQSYHRIKSAFRNKKMQNKEPVVKLTLPASRDIAARKIDKLKTENERLKRENDELLVQFVVWQYNAISNGISNSALNKPLPCKTDKYSTKPNKAVETRSKQTN